MLDKKAAYDGVPERDDEFFEKSKFWKHLADNKITI